MCPIPPSLPEFPERPVDPNPPAKVIRSGTDYVEYGASMIGGDRKCHEK
jgi:hypothetical protein